MENLMWHALKIDIHVLIIGACYETGGRDLWIQKLAADWDIMQFGFMKGKGTTTDAILLNDRWRRLKFQKWRFSNSISSAIFQPIKKIQRFLILDQNISNLSGPIFEFPPSYRVTWLQSLPKNRLRPILMKLRMMLEVDKTFTTIWLSRWSEVRVKIVPFGTILSVS